MTHERAGELLLDAAYGDLPADAARELAEHLSGCPACRAEAAELDATRGLMRRLGAEAEPGGERILLAAARQAAEARRPRPLFTRLRLGLLASAAAVLVVGGVSLKLLSAGRPGDAEEAYARSSPARLAKGGPAAASPEAAGAAAPASAMAAAPLGSAAAPQPPSPAPRALERPARKAAPVEVAPAEREVLAEQKALREGPRPAARRPAAADGASAEEAAPPPEREVLAQLKARDAARAAAAAPRPTAKAAAEPPRAAASAARSEAVATAAAAAPAARAEATADRIGVGNVAQPVEAAAEEMVRDLRARREAGELNEARRRPDPCPGGDTQRLVWLDGWGKARRFSRTGPAPGGGEATRDHYYDEAGRARLVVVDGVGPEGRYRRRIVLDAQGRRLLEDPPGAAPWPADDLALRDGADAFWAPQRCAR